MLYHCATEAGDQSRIEGYCLNVDILGNVEKTRFRGLREMEGLNRKSGRTMSGAVLQLVRTQILGSIGRSVGENTQNTQTDTQTDRQTHRSAFYIITCLYQLVFMFLLIFRLQIDIVAELLAIL